MKPTRSQNDCVTEYSYREYFTLFISILQLQRSAVYCAWIDKSNVGGKKVKQSLLQGPEGSGRLRLRTTRHSAHEGGKVVTLGTGRLYPQEYPGTHF